MATAAAFGDALGIPVHGVCSLDAIAADVGATAELLVVTDARRREVYWARYRDGARVEGPGVLAPRALEVGSADLIAGSAAHVDYFDLRVEPVESPSPRGLVRCAARALLAGDAPAPLVPRYLRRPDAVPPKWAAVAEVAQGEGQ
jgi:tRNA threonylcarbamoyl adenosine modification protein YeaZ